jgi:RHS repeat-associated protein
MGRVIHLDKESFGTTYAIDYGYNLAGEPTTMTYPSGRWVQNSYDGVGRLSMITGGPNAYVSGVTYNPAGLRTAVFYGNGITANIGYSADRLQLSALSYTKPGQTLFNLTYGYAQNYNGQNVNDGRITHIGDNVISGRSVDYTYDAMNRLSTAASTGGGGYSPWGLSWNYDRYGNITAQNVTAGSAPNYSLSVNGSNNQISATGYAYDPNGNLTSRPGVTMIYDAENRLVSYSSGGPAATYQYDGNGLRVRKVVGNDATDYVFSGTKVIADYLNGDLGREYVYNGGKLLASHEGPAGGSMQMNGVILGCDPEIEECDPGGGEPLPTYYFSDHLSVRLIIDGSGVTLGEHGHYPFGEEWYQTGTGTRWEFTSYGRDSSSGDDYAIFRSYSSDIARFSSVDLLSGSTFDPQSLNRYAYVLGDPINAIDPMGLANIQDCSTIGNDGSGGNSGFCNSNGVLCKYVMDFVDCHWFIEDPIHVTPDGPSLWEQHVAEEDAAGEQWQPWVILDPDWVLRPRIGPSPRNNSRPKVDRQVLILDLVALGIDAGNCGVTITGAVGGVVVGAPGGGTAVITGAGGWFAAEAVTTVPNWISNGLSTWATVRSLAKGGWTRQNRVSLSLTAAGWVAPFRCLSLAIQGAAVANDLGMFGE